VQHTSQPTCGNAGIARPRFGWHADLHVSPPEFLQNLKKLTGILHGMFDSEQLRPAMDCHHDAVPQTTSAGGAALAGRNRAAR